MSKAVHTSYKVNLILGYADFPKVLKMLKGNVSRLYRMLKLKYSYRHLAVSSQLEALSSYQPGSPTDRDWNYDWKQCFLVLSIRNTLPMNLMWAKRGNKELNKTRAKKSLQMMSDGTITNTFFKLP